MLYTSSLLSLISLLSFSVAKPPADVATDASLARRNMFIDWHPRIIYPSAGVKFVAGDMINITWNQRIPRDFDPDTVNQYANFTLGHWSSSKPGENLDYPLAQHVELFGLNDTITVRLPRDLQSHDTYIIALIGSSGNLSPPFTITALPKE